MPKQFELPLKVLWIWNCNEAEIAVDFYFKEGEKKYQVKGSSYDAFDSKGDLKVCSTENMDNMYFYSPNKQVFIDDEDLLKKIQNYWKNESGEIRYNTIVKRLKKHYDDLDKSLFENSPVNADKYLKAEDVTISRKQATDLVFEIEAIIGMLKAVKGNIDKDQVKGLIDQATKGFSKESIDLVLSELTRKGIL